MPFNPLLFATLTGVGAAALGSSVAQNLFNSGVSANTSNLLNSVFGTRREQNFQSARWLEQRENRVVMENDARYGRMLSNRMDRFGLERESLVNIIYPTDLGKYFISLHFMKYVRNDPTKNAQRIPEGQICLPIPANLKDTYGLQFNHSPLGFMAGAAEDVLGRGGDAANNIADALSSAVNDPIVKATLARAAVGATASTIAGVLSNRGPVAGAASYLSGAAAAAAFSEGTRRAVSMNLGGVLNPFNAVTFENVNFKTHSFQWKFHPTSQEETDSLALINRLIRQKMLPYKNKFSFDYPHLVDVKLYPSDEYLYSFKPCFIESFSLDYTPSQVPAFYRRSSAPVEVVMTMNLIENEIWTAGDFGQEGKPVPNEVPFNPSEIVNDPMNPGATGAARTGGT